MRQLSDIFCKQHPLKMPQSATVRDACRRMRDYRVGAVLVTNRDGHLVGIFTGRDAISRVLATGKSANRTKLRDVMTPKPTTMSPHMTPIRALRLMWDGGFGHIPVIDGEKIVGVISRGDFKAFEEDRFEQERMLWEEMR